MRFKTIFRILGVFLVVFSFTMLPPILLAEWYDDSSPAPFWGAFALTLGTGLLLNLLCRGARRELKTRDGFLVVTLFWLVLCVYGALPFMISKAPHETFTDAMFEAVSGLTTTGATVTPGVDYLPHAVRYYRQQLQLLGGMGIIVLAIAVLPMLGIGGMQLYRAETPGPVKDSKLTPRITETAKALWYIYVGLIICCCLAYWAAGMNFFDAVGESFATVSTGGFTMHDASFAYYKNPTIEIIGMIFMILGATNFGLHFYALQQQSVRNYWDDLEFKAFAITLLMSSLLVIAIILPHHIYSSTTETVIKASFNVVSMATTTGFISSPFASWPTFLPVFVCLLAIIGGCGASTSGGVKMIRLLLLQKQGMREINRLIHPHAVVALKFGDQSLPDNVLQAMWGFIAIFIGVFIVLVLAVMATGLDLTTAYGVVVACLANAGQGIGTATTNFVELSQTCKWLLIFAMLAGRLEIFTVLVLFTPTFWRS
ncbi:MAG: TrkH family potassium uptake protein [Gammaproteobacteria bacterium]